MTYRLQPKSTTETASSCLIFSPIKIALPSRLMKFLSTSGKQRLPLKTKIFTNTRESIPLAEFFGQLLRPSPNENSREDQPLPSNLLNPPSFHRSGPLLGK